MAGGFSVTISAVDNATKTIDAVNKRLQAMRAPAEKLAGSLQRFSKLSGLTDLRNLLGSVSHTAMDAFRSIGAIVAPLGVITGAASLAGMYRLAMSWAAWGQHLDIASRRINVAAPRLAEFEGVARRSGSSAEAMDEGLKTLRSSLYAMKNGFGTPDQVTALKQLGLGTEFVNEGVKDVTKAFPMLAAALRRTKDPELQALAGTLFLGGAYESLAPVISLTTEEFAASIRQVREHGQVSKEAIARARALAVAQVDLEDAVGGVRNSLSDVASGPLTNMLTGMGRWIDLNRDWLKERFNHYLQEFVAWLERINWSHVEAGARGFATGVVSVVTAVKDAIEWGDKWGLTIPILGGILTLKLLGPLTRIIGVLEALGAFTPPGWLLAVLGVSAVAAAEMNMPITDDLGRVIGNSGGAGGEAADAMKLVRGARGTGPEDDPQSLSYRTLQNRFVPLGTRIRNAVFGDPAASEPAPAVPKGGAMALAQRANAYLLAHGESRASSAGIIASLMRESDLDPSKPGDLDRTTGAYTAYGIGQWHADRQRAFARLFHHDIHGSTLEEQLAFKQSELAGTGLDPQSTLAGAIMHAPGATAAQAAAADARYGERPADKEGEARRRGALAEVLYAALNAPAAAGPPVAMPASAPGAGAAAPTPGAAGPNGQIGVTVRHVNAPAGTKITAQATGDAFDGPPRIENATRNIARDGY